MSMQGVELVNHRQEPDAIPIELPEGPLRCVRSISVPSIVRYLVWKNIRKLRILDPLVITENFKDIQQNNKRTSKNF